MMSCLINKSVQRKDHHRRKRIRLLEPDVAPLPPPSSRIKDNIYVNDRGQRVKWNGTKVRRLCEEEGGCGKYAIGATMYCTEHGGGKRCKTQGCDKGVAGPTDYCVGHGGGKRCRTEGCDRDVARATDYCVGHGGGKRCKTQGCDKSVAGATDYCKRHDGLDSDPGGLADVAITYPLSARPCGRALSLP